MANFASPVSILPICICIDYEQHYRWNIGGLIANGSHASISVITSQLNDSDVIAYIDPHNEHQMHKIVLSVNNDQELLIIAHRLDENNIIYKLWIEQPESIPSCLAIKPYQRKIIAPLMKDLKLFR